MGEALGQMDPVRADVRRQGDVPSNQQLQPMPAGDRLQPPGARFGVRGAEVAIDDGAALGQAGRDGLGIWGARGVGEEQQRGQGLPQASARR